MSGTIGDAPKPRSSRYVVVLDAPISIGVGGDVDRSFSFDAPGIFLDEPAIVSFLLIRAAPVVLQVTLNDLSYTRDYNPGPERTVHEIIGPAGKPRNLLTLLVHSGSCRLSDLVLWYQAL